MTKKGHTAPHAEGKESGEWVCLDATDVVVHLFQPAARQLYQLEKLWSFPSTGA
jgi:ribosome-associated protein